MPGTVDLAQRCYTGLETREDVLWVDPSLPAELDGLGFDVRCRGHWRVNLHLTSDRLRVRVPASCAVPVRVGVKGEVVELAQAAPASSRAEPVGPPGLGRVGRSADVSAAQMTQAQ